MGIWEGIKRASKALVEGPGPSSFVAGGKQIVCAHCGHDAFIESAVVLNTEAKSTPFVDFGKSATSLTCDECGRVALFVVAPERQ